MKIIKLNRRRDRYKNILFTLLFGLIFLFSCFLSCFIVIKIFNFVIHILVSLIGAIGTVLLIGAVSLYAFIKLVLNEIRSFKLSNEIGNKFDKDADEMRKQLSIVKGNSLSLDMVDDKNEVNIPYLRVINSSNETFKVKKRVRSKGNYLR